MKRVWCFLLASTLAGAQQIHIVLDSEATKVNFTLADVLHVVHGTFHLTKADFWVDTSSFKSGGEIVVDAASGNSGNHARDSRMNKNILQTDQYNAVTFKPDRIDGVLNPSGDSAFQLHGLFAIHGNPHELAMSVKSHIDGTQVSATADFNVPYVRWGMKDPSTLFLRVNDTVNITIKAVGQTH